MVQLRLNTGLSELMTLILIQSLFIYGKLIASKKNHEKIGKHITSSKKDTVIDNLKISKTIVR